MSGEDLTRWGLYVHIPFCQARCTYCDFNTITGMGEADHERYLRALRAEWRQEVLPEGELVSIFFGGGTPSLVDPRWFAQLLGDVFARVPRIASDLEVTMEANPGTVTLERLRDYRNIGINRLSLGAQARQDSHLLRLNRVHSVSDIDAAVSDARAAGFTNLSLDAIYGLPQQTLDEWEETLDGLLGLEPQHLSLYALIVEAGTPLARSVKDGTARLPVDDVVADMADLAATTLPGRGLKQYEISNYAVAGFESRHNQLYWSLNPYLALGAGAHAYSQGRRWWNIRGVRRYMDFALEGKDVLEDEERLSQEEEMREFLWLGLRQNQGVALDRFRRRFGADATAIFQEPLEEIQRIGLMVSDKKNLWLTPRGRDLANRVAEMLVDAPAVMPGSQT